MIIRNENHLATRQKTPSLNRRKLEKSTIVYLRGQYRQKGMQNTPKLIGDSSFLLMSLYFYEL
jgi:hypothetical protein